MTELETEDIACELVIKPALFLMEARLPMTLVNIVNEYIDSVRDSAADHSKSLQQETTVQLQQASLQAALADRERV